VMHLIALRNRGSLIPSLPSRVRRLALNPRRDLRLNEGGNTFDRINLGQGSLRSRLWKTNVTTALAVVRRHSNANALECLQRTDSPILAAVLVPLRERGRDPS
jgi:hypothetical protein